MTGIRRSRAEDESRLQKVEPEVAGTVPRLRSRLRQISGPLANVGHDGWVERGLPGSSAIHWFSADYPPPDAETLGNKPARKLYLTNGFYHDYFLSTADTDSPIMKSTSDGSSPARGRRQQTDDDLYHVDSIFDPEETTLEEPESGYLWCRDCERVFRYGQFRTEGNGQLCPFDNCSGALSGALPWEVRRTHHPAFPTYPMEGNRYKRGC